MALVCLLENARWSYWNQTACSRPSLRDVSKFNQFSNHTIMRNPAQNWIIEKKAAPVIHIHLEFRISR
jgi:hypothetical protein